MIIKSIIAFCSKLKKKIYDFFKIIFVKKTKNFNNKIKK